MKHHYHKNYYFTLFGEISFEFFKSTKIYLIHLIAKYDCLNVLNTAIFWLSPHQTIVAKKNCVLSSKEKSLYYIENTSRGLRFCERISLLSQNREELAKTFTSFKEVTSFEGKPIFPFKTCCSLSLLGNST